MTTTEKTNLIERYAQGASAFDRVLDWSPDLLHFRPFDGAWTIAEHVVHFVESDIAAFHRYRKAVAEPGGPAIGYDEDAWTACLDYHEDSLSDVLALLKLLRSWASKHLRRIVDQDWTHYRYIHNSLGSVNLEAWIQSYIEHVDFHWQYIQRNQAAFAATKVQE